MDFFISQNFTAKLTSDNDEAVLNSETNAAI